MAPKAGEGTHVLSGSGAAASFAISLTQHIDIEDVIQIAVEAGKVIMEVYASPETWNVEAKADASPVTLADKKANHVICSGLKRIAPHIPIVSEENRQFGLDVRGGYHYCWCVDPLDGTKEFLKKTGEFTVNIALLKQSRPVAGVVVVPTTGAVYYAMEGAGAWRRAGGGADERLQAARYDPGQEGMTVVASASHLSAETTEFVSGLKAPRFEQMGSSLKLVMVAEGRAHVYPRLAPTCEWDTAAAHALVLEAGGRVVQAGRCDGKGTLLEDWKAALARDEEVVYNKPDVLNPFFVVYGRR